MNRPGIAQLSNVFLIGVALFAGCAQPQMSTPIRPLINSQAAPEPAAPNQADWNIFPDPMTGRVEIYRDGAHVGSVTGEESEDPPIPRKRESAGTE